MARKYTDRMFVHLLDAMSQAVSADFVRVLSERGFSVRQWRVLGSLWDREDLTLGELAEESFCGNSTITRVVERLEDQELIRRRSDEIDRRKTYVSLTPEGRRKIADLVKISEIMEKNVIKVLGPDSVKHVMTELRKMITRLGKVGLNSRRSDG